MLIYLDIKIPHLKIAHLGGNLEVGNIEIHPSLMAMWDARTQKMRQILLIEKKMVNLNIPHLKIAPLVGNL